MTKNTIQYFWKDRKRHLGIPMSFTRYMLSEDRLFLSEGLLNIKDNEVLLYRVRDISVSRNLWQRLFGVGTVLVDSSDKTTPQLILKNIKDPVNVKEMLHKAVEDMKIKRRVRVGEIMSGGDAHDCCHHHDDDEDDLDDDWDNE